ncbi:MAG: thioredoxin, partial [Thermofilum sp.]|nr:thioredoxin [Thermofilum sp.]
MLLKGGATKREVTCPYDANGNSITFHENLAKCKLAIADFWAEWCAPCRLIEPIFESLAEKYKGKVAFLRVNVDENPDLAAEYQVMSIPTLIVFSRGKEFTRFIGYSPQLS